MPRGNSVWPGRLKHHAEDSAVEIFAAGQTQRCVLGCDFFFAEILGLAHRAKLHGSLHVRCAAPVGSHWQFSTSMGLEQDCRTVPPLLHQLLGPPVEVRIRVPTFFCLF